MKKDIIGIEIENLSAAQTVRRVMSMLRQNGLNVCALLRADMLLTAEEQEEYRVLLSKLSLGIIGDGEILKALGDEREERYREVEELAFLPLLLDELSEEKRTVAVLTKTEEEKVQLIEYICGAYPALSLAGAFSLELSDDVDDAVNHINGLDADLVLAELPSPEQEELVFANKGKLNISMWLGLGRGGTSGKKSEKVPGFLEKLLVKRLFKKKLTQYQSEKE